MPRILMTGAAGGIGSSLRKLLPPVYPDLLLSDLKAPADLGADEKFKAAFSFPHHRRHPERVRIYQQRVFAATAVL